MRRYANLLCATGALAALLALWGSPLLFAEAALLTAAYAVFFQRIGDERARLAASYIYSLWLYQSVARIVPLSPMPRADELLASIDAALFGTGAVCSGCAPQEPGTWSEFLGVSYLSYHVYLHGALAWSLRSKEAARRLSTYVFSAFGLGFAGYFLFPAMGPTGVCSFPTSGPLASLNALVVAAGSPGWDVFPSLHVLIPLCLLRHDYKYARRRFWPMLLVCGAMMLAALCLGYHYLIDLVAGTLWFGAVLVLVERASPPP